MANQTIIGGGAAGYCIQENGEDILGPYTSMWQAEAALDALQRKQQRKKRNCITCSEPFMSEGNHNRMCGSCRDGVGSADGWAA